MMGDLQKMSVAIDELKSIFWLHVTPIVEPICKLLLRIIKRVWG